MTAARSFDVTSLGSNLESNRIIEYNKIVIIYPLAWKGGENMQELINFIIAVSAQVVGNLLCKWLDSKKKDDN